eukprot:5097014-Pyramimonas_sp.AAC.1
MVVVVVAIPISTGGVVATPVSTSHPRVRGMVRTTIMRICKVPVVAWVVPLHLGTTQTLFSSQAQ